MWIRQLFGESTPPKNLTEVDPSTIWGVYTSKIFDGCMSVKYLGGLHLQNIGRMWIRQIFGASRHPKNLTDVDPSTIWGVYTSQKFDGGGSVNYWGGLHLQNI